MLWPWLSPSVSWCRPTIALAWRRSSPIGTGPRSTSPAPGWCCSRPTGSTSRQLGQVGDVVTVPAQTRLELVELRGEQGFHELRRDRLLAHPPPLLEGRGEVPLDLQRGAEALGQQLDRLLGDHVTDGDAFGEAPRQQPVGVGPLLAGDALEVHDRGAVPDLLHGRAA